MRKLMYKPLALLLAAVSGAVASVIYKRVWHLMSKEDEAPKPTDEDRDWSEVLSAAAIHGMVFALVRAVMDRAGAVGVRRLTGRWPA